MTILYVLIPLALLLGGGALLSFVLAVRKGQFDDLNTPAYRALIDETERKRDHA